MSINIVLAEKKTKFLLINTILLKEDNISHNMRKLTCSNKNTKIEVIITSTRTTLR